MVFIVIRQATAVSSCISDSFAQFTSTNSSVKLLTETINKSVRATFAVGSFFHAFLFLTGKYSLDTGRIGASGSLNSSTLA